MRKLFAKAQDRVSCETHAFGAAAALRNYTQQRREGKNPAFRAADIGLKEKTDYWN